MKIKPLLGILAASLMTGGSYGQTVSTVTTNGLFEPYGVTVDLSTNLYYFTDSANHRIVKYNPNTAEFFTVSAVVGFSEGIVLARGGLVVADSFNNSIDQVTLEGSVSRLAGGTRGNADGVGTAAQFDSPSGLAVDGAGNIYIADLKNNVVRRLAPDNSVTTYARGFNEPAGVAVGEGGRVFVADTLNHVIKVIEPNGTVNLIAGRVGVSGSDDGNGSSARFDRPRGVLWVGGETGLLVADSGNQTIRSVTFKGGDWRVVTFAGLANVPGFVDGPLTTARFNGPIGLARDLQGSILVADLYNKALRRIDRVASQLPVVIPIGGSYSNTISITVTSATPNTIIHYTTDASDPTEFSPVITGPLTFAGGPVPLKVRGFSPDFATSAVVSNNYSFFVNPLAINIPGGTFTNEINLAISTLTANPVLHFTTDGTLPTTNSPVWSNRSYNVNGTLLVQGFRDGFTPSDVISNQFVFVVAAPTISPPGATTNNNVTVTLTSGTTGRELFWTIDDSEPSRTNGTRYTGPFRLGTNGTLKVKGFRDGFVDSPTVSATFNLSVSTPVITPAGATTNNTVTVSLTSDTSNAKLYWTIDGSEPSATNGTLYISPFVLDRSGTLKVRGFKDGYVESSIVNGIFNFAVANPVIAPSSATTNNTVIITITSETALAALYWTINGSEPSPTNGFRYTEPFVLGTNGTLRVKGFRPGFADSATILGAFSLTVGTPTISPAGSTANNVVSVTLGTDTLDARLYWTINGSEPSPTNGTLYSASDPFLLGTNGTLKVRGFKDGFTPSTIASAVFNLSVAPPVIAPAGATANNTVSVTLTTTTLGTDLFWTIDGSEPARTNGTKYTGEPFLLGTNGTLKVKGFKNGFVESPTISAIFNLSVASPVISPSGFTTNNPVLVTLASETDLAQLYWTINGTEPSRTNGTLYSVPFLLANTGTLRVRGFRDGFLPSQTTRAEFILGVATPVIFPAGATTNNTVTVRLTTATQVTDLFWTIDGSEPSRTNGTRYTGVPFVLGTNGLLQVKGFKDGFLDSGIASAVFNLIVANPAISPAGATTNNTVTITLSSATPNATFYWTIDGSEPTTNSVFYNGPFVLGTNGTLKVKGFRNGFVDSQTVSGVFNLIVASPVISPPSGTSINSVTITISSTTPGAEIRYTVDSSEPTAISTLYVSPFTIVTNTLLKAGAFRNGFAVSAVVSNDYKIQVDRPVISPGSGFFPNGTTVTITVVRTNASIYYTLNGQDPAQSDTLYTGPFKVDQASAPAGTDLRALKARAFAPNTLPSEVASGQPFQTNSIGFPRDLAAGIGATVVVPVVVNLSTNDALKSIEFRVEMAPLSTAAPVMTKDLRALSFLSTDFIQVVGPARLGEVAIFSSSSYRRGPTNGLTVTAIGTNANLSISNFAVVAMLSVPIPANASENDTYKIQILQPSGTSDAQQRTVPLAPLEARTITVRNIPYIVGDSAFGAWYNAGDFGNGNLDNADVNNAFYASLGVRVPYTFSDVFNAMDAFPVDTLGSAGGDGQIRFLDWQIILDRSLRLDSGNWRRAWAPGGVRLPSATALPPPPEASADRPIELQALSSEVVYQAEMVAASLENVKVDSQVDIPIYVSVTAGSSLSGLQFRVVLTPLGNSTPLGQQARFIRAAGMPASRSLDGLLPLNQTADSWSLGAFRPSLEGNNLLGYVSFHVPINARVGDVYHLSFAIADGSPDLNTQYNLKTTSGLVWVESPALRLLSAERRNNGNAIALRWQTSPGKKYIVESTADLGRPNWTLIATDLMGTGTIQEFIDTNATQPERFYRVRLLP